MSYWRGSGGGEGGNLKPHWRNEIPVLPCVLVVYEEVVRVCCLAKIGIGIKVAPLLLFLPSPDPQDIRVFQDIHVRHTTYAV